jgi:zinc and cadmium transporter
MNAGLTRKKAFELIFFTSLCSAVGGVLGFFILGQLTPWLPYILVVAASSFLYISIADLMPQMHERSSLKEAGPQLVLVAVGISAIYAVTLIMHALR